MGWCIEEAVEDPDIERRINILRSEGGNRRARTDQETSHSVRYSMPMRQASMDQYISHHLRSFSLADHRESVLKDA